MKIILVLTLSAVLAGCSTLTKLPPEKQIAATPAIVIEQWDHFRVTSPDHEAVSQETVGQLQQLIQKLFHRYAVSIGTFDRATLEFADSNIVFDRQTFTVSGKITAIMQTPATTPIPTPVQWRPNSRGMMIDQSNPRILGFLLGNIEITRDGPPLQMILSPTNLIFGWDRKKTLTVADLKNAIDQNFDYINIIFYEDPKPAAVTPEGI